MLPLIAGSPSASLNRTEVQYIHLASTPMQEIRQNTARLQDHVESLAFRQKRRAQYIPHGFQVENPPRRLNHYSTGFQPKRLKRSPHPFIVDNMLIVHPVFKNPNQKLGSDSGHSLQQIRENLQSQQVVRDHWKIHWTHGSRDLLNCGGNDPRIYRDTTSSFPFSVALCVGFHHAKSRIADFAR
jgi:hypothetical protein